MGTSSIVSASSRTARCPIRLQYPPFDTRALETGVSQDVVSYRAGDPASRDLSLFLNGGNLYDNGMELYGNVGLSRRSVEAAALFRRAIDPVTDRTANPDGFLPIIRPLIGDYAGTLGLRGRMLEDWRYDLAATYGRNGVKYDVSNTQSSAGVPGSAFEAGSVRFKQRVLNLDLFRTFSRFDELRLAAGGELRRDSYALRPTAGTTAIEGFAGFGPAQFADAGSNVAAGYIDLEADLVPSVLVAVAGRLERHSDVGTLPAVSLSLRYEPTRHFAVRGAVGRSERAPSLAQSFYGTISTEPGPYGVASNVARVSSAAATAAGATALRPERNATMSAGFSLAPTPTLSLSADAYRIEVDERITLLQSLTDASAPTAEFSANAADTRTTGVDVAAHYGVQLGRGSLRLMTGMNAHRTSVLRALTIGGLGLGRLGTERIEHGQPSSSVITSASYARGALGMLLRTQRFGEVRVAGLQGDASLDQTFRPRWVTDANVSYTMLRKYTLTAGADNLLDTYPERNRVPGSATTNQRGNGFFGILPYNAASPFAFNGRFVYGRLSIYL